MKSLLAGFLSIALLTACSHAPVQSAMSDPYPRVAFITNMGDFVVQLDREQAPLTVANFLRYVDAGFYDGTLIHRVIPGFAIQGGGFTAAYARKKTRAPIPNESGNGLSNARGTIAMVREGTPHSATAQFYINLADNTRLDPQPNRWGYAVFGKVISGMSVVNRIAAVKTGKAGPFGKDAPLTQVIIVKAVELQPSLD
jgi:cyclophilin family peptidyl-prolyl cis-trans isomerase